MVIQDPRQNLIEPSSKRLQIKPVTTIKGDAVLISNHSKKNPYSLTLPFSSQVYILLHVFIPLFLFAVEDSVGRFPLFALPISHAYGFGGRGRSGHPPLGFLYFFKKLYFYFYYVEPDVYQKATALR